MRGAVAGMHVGVDEAGRNELSLGVDDSIDAAFEAVTDVQNFVALPCPSIPVQLHVCRTFTVRAKG
jgi:hypothetical protein